MLPDTALQVTPVLVLLPLTVALNCCWELALTVGFCGLTETLSFEVTVIVAEADFVVACWLVAVIVTVVCEGKPAGAVYWPVCPIVPAPVLGDIDQVTALLVALSTVAVSCNDLPRLMLAVLGEMLTVNGAVCAFATNATTHRADKKRSTVLQILIMVFTLNLP
jgi:hypothetical protein